ncbi:MAG: type VI secretion system tip protein VgrG [Polyangiaceae bacterium]|nr:type VI secretion system tip protein VgrG [Polyangiaceae bacterium]
MSNQATTTIASGDALDVRSFAIKQGMSQLFHIDVRAVSRNLDIDFDEVIGKDASVSLRTQWTAPSWHGICTQIDQVRVDAQGLATYSLVIQPRAWLMTQRRNYRIFQFETELDIVKKMLGEWNVEFEERVDPGNYKPRKYRCQYDENDFSFISRMLEDAGVSYYFEEKNGNSVMVLDDAPNARSLSKPLIRFHDSPAVTDGEFVTRVAVSQRVRPGKMTVGDLDYRKPAEGQPRFSAQGGLPQEQNLEQFHYEPGAFLYQQGSAGGNTPTADDRGASRVDSQLGTAKTENRLLGKRGNAKRITFESNVLDLVPGVITSVTNHPHRALSSSTPMLVTEALIEGDHDTEWRVHAEIVPTDDPFKPSIKTARPKVQGLESATVVGPDGAEIHTDEYGRVRVQFHWDREGKSDENSSCWIPSSQPWAGAGFGGVNLPRIGQEVLVEFLGGDPDRPVVIGRVFTETQSSPYKLPKYKDVMTLRSNTTGRMVMGAADGSVQPSPTSSLLGGGIPYNSGQIGELMSTLGGPFCARSADGGTHNWGGSEISLNDKDQVFYTQADKDRHDFTRSASRGVIGAERTTTIGTDDLTHVENKQTTNVGSDQALSVGGDQSITVTGNLTETVTGFLSQNVTKGIGISSGAYILQLATGGIVLRSDHMITLRVGKSEIVITDQEIKIQSGDKVHINPRQGEEEEAKKAKEAAEAKEKAKQDVLNTLENGGLGTNAGRAVQGSRNALQRAGYTEQEANQILGDYFENKWTQAGTDPQTVQSSLQGLGLR